ncbi:O-antigen ligase [Okibacterium sp. HSC-33S16]|uniref:O-antigen ligase family protein n=1 Tax=Okibacterium sp. HSC-33S16 TaxID=2910965 RepID=UPI0020A13506|nr:O-antigen ligase family protein [Okibacterium sp. HSC-33S16]MCP2031683.1 O-antigen ligase [Okibacterium sp. HSC-33S16]
MTSPRPLPHPVFTALVRGLGSAQAAAALSLTIFGVAFATPLIRSILGWNGLIGVMVALVPVAILIVMARWDTIEWHGLLPISILAFMGWCLLSTFWTDHQWVTLSSALYQIAFAFLGLTVALTRDLIQIVRSVGAVLRTLLTASIAVEVLSGLILDMPFPFMGVQGSIAMGGPIQGVFGTRNMLGFMALIAVVTFIIEWRTRAVTRPVLIYSLAVALACLGLSQSPITILVSFALGLAALALYGLRQAPKETRRTLQWALAGLTIVVLSVTYLSRLRVLALLNAGSEFEFRYLLWFQTWKLVPVNQLEGWGWSGFWQDVAPYTYINNSLVRDHETALNAFLDVYLQVGLVGLLAFLSLLVFAFVRSWLLASNRRTVTYTWPALVLVALIATSAAESFVLVEAGWLLLVVCTVKASQNMSWRTRLRTGPKPPVPVE